MFLLRHGQSYFNLHFTAKRVDPGIEDPELTPLGWEQAAAAARALAAVSLTRVIVSPYTRALQTAEPLRVLTGLPVTIMHEVRERAAFACDIGSPSDTLAARFPQHDFSQLPRQWWHTGIESERETVARADAFRAVMAAREDRATTLLVGHWAFILALTGVSLRNGEFMQYDPDSPPPERLVWE